MAGVDTVVYAWQQVSVWGDVGAILLWFCTGPISSNSNS